MVRKGKKKGSGLRGESAKLGFAKPPSKLNSKSERKEWCLRSWMARGLRPCGWAPRAGDSSNASWLAADRVPNQRRRRRDAAIMQRLWRRRPPLLLSPSSLLLQGKKGAKEGINWQVRSASAAGISCVPPNSKPAKQFCELITWAVSKPTEWPKTVGRRPNRSCCCGIQHSYWFWRFFHLVFQVLLVNSSPHPLRFILHLFPPCHHQSHC